MKHFSGEASNPSVHWTRVAAFLWIVAVGVWCIALPPQVAAPQSDVLKAAPHDRVVVVIVDSLRPENLTDELMPNLSRLQARKAVHTCSANFTLPCVQTLFEGKQSPFAAGLSNFTGNEGSATSLPALWHALGDRVHMISDHTLDSLYGRFAATSISVETLPGDHLEHDLEALRIGTQWIAQHRDDHVLVHVVGTDKVAHHQQPGSPAYVTHWRAVDAGLGELLLAAKGAEVVVTGDHGHGDIGHHTRQSVVLASGPRVEAMFAAWPASEIEQMDLMWLLGAVTGATLPADYEGAFPTLPGTTAYSLAQATSLGFAGPDVSDAFAQNALRKRERAQQHPWEYLGALFLGVGAFGVGVGSHHRVSKRGWLHLGAVSLATAAMLLFPTPWVGALFAVLTTAAILGSPYFVSGRRVTAAALALAALAAATSAFAEPWRDVFHTRGGVHLAWFGFYAMVLASGAVLSHLASRSLRFAPEGAMAFGILVFPSGVYYYQAGQNFMTGAVFGSVIAGVAALFVGFRPKRADALPLGILVSGLAFFMLQEAGGWEWNFFPHKWLRGIGVWGSAALTAAITAVVASRTYSPWPRRVSAAAIVSTVALGFGYAVLVGELPPERFVTAMGVVAFVTTWERWTTAHRNATEDLADWALAVMLTGAQLFVGWMMIDGYRLNNVDFSFALNWFGGFANEATVFALTQIAAMLKYATPVGLMLVPLWFALGHQRFGRVVYRSVVVGAFELLVVVIQILFGQAFQTERLWELAVADLTFESNLIMMIPMMALPLLAVGAWRARVRPDPSGT